MTKVNPSNWRLDRRINLSVLLQLQAMERQFDSGTTKASR